MGLKGDDDAYNRRFVSPHVTLTWCKKPTQFQRMVKRYVQENLSVFKHISEQEKGRISTMIAKVSSRLVTALCRTYGADDFFMYVFW
jgi:hypothetical protein